MLCFINEVNNLADEYTLTKHPVKNTSSSVMLTTAVVNLKIFIMNIFVVGHSQIVACKAEE